MWHSSDSYYYSNLTIIIIMQIDYVKKGKVYVLFRSWTNDHKKNRSTVFYKTLKIHGQNSNGVFFSVSV